jgi:hypothetical protein
MSVVAKAGLRLWLIAPDEDIDLGDVDPRSPFRIEQAKEGGPIEVTVLPPIPDSDDVEAHLARCARTPDEQRVGCGAADLGPLHFR